jgi:muramidase (phage lysozyme)
MVRLLAPFAKVKIGDRLFQTGDGKLRYVAISLGEDKRASNCRFEVSDPGLKIAAAFFEMSFTAGGIEVPSDLLEDPQQTPATPGGTVASGGESSVTAGELTAEEKAFLDVIAWAEGTSGPNGYRTMFTGKLFDGFERHPAQINCNASRTLCSDAAGRYQFLKKTWNGLNMPDFTPANQDRGAIKLVKGRGALQDVRAGRFDAAVTKCRQEWASFPGAGYDQPEKSLSKMREVWEKALAKYRGGGSAAPTQAPAASSAATATSTTPVQDKAQEAAAEVSQKGQEIIVSLGFSPSQTVEYHFIHTGTNTTGRGADQTVFEGQSIRWLMTRRKLNTAYSNLTLRDLATKVCQRYGLTLEMEGNGPTYQHLDQTGITDYELLLREAQAIGYRVTDRGSTLKLTPLRPNFTGFVITKDYLKPGGLAFGDRATKDMPVNSNAPASTPAVNAAEQKTTLNRDTGQPEAITKEDSTATSTASKPPESAVTGAAKPPVTGTVLDGTETGLPTQKVGAIDLADGRAEAEVIKDESRRVKGYESRASLFTSPESLILAPGSIVSIDSEIVPTVFAREWRVGSVSHSWQVGSPFTTDVELYSPQRQRPPQATAGGAGGIGGGMDGTALMEDGTASQADLKPGGFICPIRSGTFGEGIGYRAWAGRNHNGIDIAAPTNTPVIAPADGVVVRVVRGCRVGNQSCGGGWGNYIVIRHGGGIYSLVAHLTLTYVREGQTVKQGSTTGTVGNTGRSFGAHLHFEFRSGGIPPGGKVVPPSELGVVYTGIGGSKRSGMKY